MTHRYGKHIIPLLGLMLAAMIAPSTGMASLNDQYPADENGIVHDPSIDALATWIAGRPYTIDCTPDPGDGTLGRTWFIGTENPDESTTWNGVSSSEMNGDECGALDRLLSPPASFYKQSSYSAPVTKSGKRLGNAVIVWPSTRTAQAAEALWTLSHEVTHGIFAGADLFMTPPGADDFAPAFDEGLVECTSMRNIWNTIKHVTSVAWLRHDLYANAQDDHQQTPSEYRAVC